MRVAVLGCGGMGRVHAGAYAEMPGVELVGVCDLYPGAAENVGAIYGVPAFASYEELLDRVKPEAVSITLPSELHKEYAIRTAEAGVHVISEKPIALTLEDAQAVIDSCERNGVQLFVGHVVRFFPEYVQMKEKIASGQLGRVGTANLRRIGGHPGEAKPWFKDESKSGGVIVDLMIHDIDFVRWALGEVKSVYCTRRVDDHVDYALVTLVFESGAVANVEAYWGYPGPFRTAAEFAGSKGLIRGDSGKTSSLQVYKEVQAEDGEKKVAVPSSPGVNSPFYLELQHFIECIRDGKEPRVTAWDAYKALEIANAARLSAETGEAVILSNQGRASNQ
ncbi:Gfo/Idh/MocA family protein [Paenibacillus koleovorans]|uniref:Gfo/Idh/MocA family protein n=1 Tax=Paenibacillus koleovorans TaxID=121608 RepID=UPI000FD6BB09|nr:Gfo/Idh/MocA family oxidoreductase [Paenibacillus koleovorans]